jgi:cell division protein FtsL
MLLVVVVVGGGLLVSQRYKSRLHYMKLEELKKAAYQYDQNYTKLQLELGTYSSGLVLQDIAYNKLGLVTPDNKHIIGTK